MRRAKELLEIKNYLLNITLIFSFLFVGTINAESIENSLCLDCHDNISESLNYTAHKLNKVDPEINCVSCHTGGEVHIDDPSTDNILTFKKVGHGKNDLACQSCHDPHLAKSSIGFEAHLRENIQCVECHKVHNADPHASNEQLCKSCHISVLNSFKKRSNHPVTEGNLTCVGCHDFIGKNEQNVGHGSTSNCVSCHPEQQGPFLFEHEATSSFATEGSGCIACHDPHGSANERLLTQPDDRLCRQCHVQTEQHSATAHSGQYAGNRCIDCHSQVHGSFETRNRFLLDPNLGMKLGGSLNSCYCHEQN